MGSSSPCRRVGLRARRRSRNLATCSALAPLKNPLAQALVYLDGGPRESARIWHAGASRRSDRSHVSIQNASRRDSHSVKTEAQVRREHWRHSSLFKYRCYQACTVADSYRQVSLSPTRIDSQNRMCHNQVWWHVQSHKLHQVRRRISSDVSLLPREPNLWSAPSICGKLLGTHPGSLESIRAKIRCAPRILAPTSLTY